MRSSTELDESVSKALGNLVSLMNKEIICNVGKEAFAEAFDEIISPQFEANVPMKCLIYDEARYFKASQDLIESRDLSRRNWQAASLLDTMILRA